MNHLFSTPRVVIVDDLINDAWPIVEAMSKLEIPAIWYKGTGREDFPKAPLNGVRLLFLDLVLSTAGFDANTAAGAVFNTVAPTVSSGPLLLVIWTSHPDDINAFKTALKKYNSGRADDDKVLPIDIMDMPKGVFIKHEEADAGGQTGSVNGDQFDMQAILNKVQTILDELKPFGDLLKWEASCSKAAATSVNDLSAMALKLARGTDRWQDKLRELMDQLTMAAGGKEAIADKDSQDYKSALYESLAMIHEDAVRSHALLMDGPAIQHIPSNIDVNTVPPALNSFLLTAFSASPNVPGVVLLWKNSIFRELPFPANIDDKPYRGFIQSYFGSHYGPQKEEILSSCVPVLIEVSPACDFAQQKRKRLRFVPGLLIPEQLECKTVKNADYLKRIGPILYEEKVFYLIVESLHFFSAPLETNLPSPLFRLRSHVLVDIQAWLGSHLSRPGHLSI